MNISVLGYITALSYFIPPTVGTVKFKKLERPVKIFYFYCIIAVINVVLQLVLGRLKISNLFFQNYYRLLDFWFLALVYISFSSSGQEKKILGAGAILYTFIWIILTTFFDVHLKFDVYITVFTKLILVIFSIGIMLKTLANISKNIKEEPLFWISSGVIFHSASTIFIEPLGNYLLHIELNLFNIAWHFNWLAIIISNIFFTRCFYSSHNT